MAQRCDLGDGQRGGFGDFLLVAPHPREGGGVQDEPHLVSVGRAERGPPRATWTLSFLADTRGALGTVDLLYPASAGDRN